MLFPNSHISVVCYDLLKAVGIPVLIIPISKQMSYVASKGSKIAPVHLESRDQELGRPRGSPIPYMRRSECLHLLDIGRGAGAGVSVVGWLCGAP